MSGIKERLDQVVCCQNPELSKTRAQSLIKSGNVTVNGIVITKPSKLVNTGESGDAIEITGDNQKYVCRAGLKLERALEVFSVNPDGLVVLDAGLSTGGFTHCLLQNGAERVYGIDVGRGQVHETIRADSRVVVMEQTNLRTLGELPELVDLVTLDLSFISLTKVIENVLRFIKPGGRIITLIKPQFESEPGDIRRGGLVTDPLVHKRVQEKIISYFSQLGVQLIGEIIESPIKGNQSGNTEFLACWVCK